MNDIFADINTPRLDLQAPVPEQPGNEDWKTLPIAECDEKLVPLGPFSEHNQVFSDGIYFGEGSSSPYKTGELEGTLITAFVRDGVAKRLAHAASLLPEGHAFLVWDSYRPLSVQKALYDDYYNQIVGKNDLSPESTTQEAQRFVSLPSTNPACPPPHNTGGAIDLTIVKFSPEAWLELKQLEEKIKIADTSDDWKAVYDAEMRSLALLHQASVLDMGTAFDQVSPETSTRFYEEKQEAGSLNSEDEARLHNRRLLVNAMHAAGFSNYPEEWWHFDFGNQFAAKRTGKPAIYGAVALSDSNGEWETMRRDHHQGNLVLQNAPPLYLAVKFSDAAGPAEFARYIARKYTYTHAPCESVAKRLEA